ncbi:MAG: HEAT repeat domain-containing protein [Erythrobacter sp.]
MTLELAEMVRGPERDALLSRAKMLGVDRVLLRHSVSRIPQNRLLAAEALAMFPAGRERVRQMLRDTNPYVRLGAALALAQNQAAPPARELVERLRLGTEERSLLTASLMRDLVEADPGSVEDLLGDGAIPSATKLAALDALAAGGRVEHAPLVAKMAEDSAHDSDLLARIHHALGRIGHPSGHKAILQGLVSPAWQVRAAAAQAAGSNGLVEAVELLGDLLEDTHWWVRFRAGDALWRLGNKGRDVLEKTARDGELIARDAAQAMLAEKRS